jgi:PIN domain nuclease of toxin-antitoxin system
MRLLLDTHVLLWWLADDASLGESARDAIANPETLILFSAASIWEIRIKQAIGKIDLPANFDELLADQPFEPLSVNVSHAHAVKDLPMLHRDPFDRMLIAQARIERLTILTRDQIITQYDVPTLLA